MTLQLLIAGSQKTLHIEGAGQVDLPKQPPFDVVTHGPAVLVTVETGVGSPVVSRLFDAWYMQAWRIMVTAWDGGPCVRFKAACVEVNWERGLQVTRSWSEPLRRAQVDGRCLLYRPTPRHQLVDGTTNRYVLAAERWEQLAVPECFKRPAHAVEAAN